MEGGKGFFSMMFEASKSVPPVLQMPSTITACAAALPTPSSALCPCWLATKPSLPHALPLSPEATVAVSAFAAAARAADGGSGAERVGMCDAGRGHTYPPEASQQGSRRTRTST